MILPIYKNRGEKNTIKQKILKLQFREFPPLYKKPQERQLRV